MTNSITIRKMRIILPTLLVGMILLLVDSGIAMVPQEIGIVPDEPELDVLNFFCFVVINGSWHRFTLFMYLTFEFFAYYLNVYDFPLLEFTTHHPAFPARYNKNVSFKLQMSTR